MALKPLTIETLDKLDYGSAGLAANQALAIAVADLDERGGASDKKPREVIIKIKMTPTDRAGEFDTEVEVQAKLPAMKTAKTRCNVGRHQKQTALFFQENSPTDPSQRTIDEMETKEGS